MQEVVDFFRMLFSDEGFMPRWICGRWTGFNGWLYITGDILTGTAYLAIPTLILRFVHGRKVKYFRTLYYLFPAFIVLCGSTHILNMMMFWFPAYRLGALLAVLTGIVSWITVAHIYKTIPFAISLTPRDKLEEEVLLRREAEAKLVQQQRELEQKNEQLESFASIASHDMMEPLRKIGIFADRLERTNASTLNTEGQQYVAKIQGAVTRMTALLRNILEYSKISEVAFEQVDLNALLSETLSDLELKIADTKATIRVITTLPVIEGDGLLLQQGIVNLLSNAIKFSKPGVPPVIEIWHEVVDGKDLYAPAQEYLKITEKGLQYKRFLRLYIKDNGIGFDDMYKDQVFQLFQRLHGKESSYGGTGIGLAIVKRICDLHNGWVRAESKPGEGSTFILILPTKQQKDESIQQS